MFGTKSNYGYFGWNTNHKTDSNIIISINNYNYMVINIGLSQNHLTHLSEVSASIFKPSKEIIYRFLRPCTIIPILNMGNIFPSNIS